MSIPPVAMDFIPHPVSTNPLLSLDGFNPKPKDILSIMEAGVKKQTEIIYNSQLTAGWEQKEDHNIIIINLHLLEVKVEDAHIA